MPLLEFSVSQLHFSSSYIILLESFKLFDDVYYVDNFEMN